MKKIAIVMILMPVLAGISGCVAVPVAPPPAPAYYAPGPVYYAAPGYDYYYPRRGYYRY